MVPASLPSLETVDYFTPQNWAHLNEYESGHQQYQSGLVCSQELRASRKAGVVYLMDANLVGNKDRQSPLFTPPRLGNDKGALEAKGIWGALSVWKDEPANMGLCAYLGAGLQRYAEIFDHHRSEPGWLHHGF